MRKLAFTKENESTIRRLLYTRWEIRYAARRAEALKSLANNHTSVAERKEIMASRYYKKPAPVDLSGACKIAAQVSMRLFHLDGEVISNQRHTFVVLASGEIYDFNRYCRDVNSMLLGNRDPYEINYAWSDSAKAVHGRESWAGFIAAFVHECETYFNARKIALYHKGGKVGRLPEWAELPDEPITVFPDWKLGKLELNHGA